METSNKSTNLGPSITSHSLLSLGADKGKTIIPTVFRTNCDSHDGPFTFCSRLDDLLQIIPDGQPTIYLEVRTRIREWTTVFTTELLVNQSCTVHDVAGKGGLFEYELGNNTKWLLWYEQMQRCEGTKWGQSSRKFLPSTYYVEITKLSIQFRLFRYLWC